MWKCELVEQQNSGTFVTDSQWVAIWVMVGIVAAALLFGGIFFLIRAINGNKSRFKQMGGDRNTAIAMPAPQMNYA